MINVCEKKGEETGLRKRENTNWDADQTKAQSSWWGVLEYRPALGLDACASLRHRMWLSQEGLITALGSSFEAEANLHSWAAYAALKEDPGSIY